MQATSNHNDSWLTLTTTHCCRSVDGGIDFGQMKCESRRDSEYPTDVEVCAPASEPRTRSSLLSLYVQCPSRLADSVLLRAAASSAMAARSRWFAVMVISAQMKIPANPPTTKAAANHHSESIVPPQSSAYLPRNSKPGPVTNTPTQ